MAGVWNRQLERNELAGLGLVFTLIGIGAGTLVDPPLLMPFFCAIGMAFSLKAQRTPPRRSRYATLLLAFVSLLIVATTALLAFDRFAS